ncbi:MAG: hypothetical protein M3Z96_04010 [Pseudomonadota bacterium]|nr:hypothetical protein [Pseudomonadota bacterium]
MVLSPFIVFLLGTISAGVAVYTEASLHYAVEAAARCYSVNSITCGSAKTTPSPLTVSYAKTIYLGTGSPTFTASLSSTTCGNAANPGHQVNATLPLSFVLGPVVPQWNISLSATACFP